LSLSVTNDVACICRTATEYWDVAVRAVEVNRTSVPSASCRPRFVPFASVFSTGRSASRLVTLVSVMR